MDQLSHVLASLQCEDSNFNQLPSFLEKVLVDERPKVVIYDVSPYFFMLNAWMLSCRCRSFGASYPISYPR